MDDKNNMTKNFDYYIEHQSELVKEYNGEYIIIANQKVVGHFKTLDEAIDFASKNYKPGEFLLHQVGEGVENYTTTISRIGSYA